MNDEIHPYMIKQLMIGIIKQAIQDLRLTGHKYRDDVRTAKAFLFDDDYHIQWGDMEITFTEMCEVLDVDRDLIRRRVDDGLVGRHYSARRSKVK